MSNNLSTFANNQIATIDAALAKTQIRPEAAETLKNFWSLLEDNENAVREAIMKELKKIIQTRYTSTWDELIQDMAAELYRKLEAGEKIEDQNYNFFIFDLRSAKAVLETVEELIFIEYLDEQGSTPMATDFEEIDLGEPEELTEEEELALEMAMMRWQDLACGAGPCNHERHQFTEEDLREANTRDPLAFDLEIDKEIEGLHDEDCGDPTISNHWSICARYTAKQKAAIEELLENVVVLRLLYNELRPQEIYGLKGYSHEEALGLIERLGSIADALEGDYFSEPIFIINDNEITDAVEYRD
jgi:hypothetical protein